MPMTTTDAITDDLILDYDNDNDGKLIAITQDNYSQSNRRLTTQE